MKKIVFLCFLISFTTMQSYGEEWEYLGQKTYTLKLDETNTVIRTLRPLELERDLRWEVYRNGRFILERSATHDRVFNEWDNYNFLDDGFRQVGKSPGAIKIFLTDVIDSGRLIVSNILEFNTGEHNTVKSDGVTEQRLMFTEKYTIYMNKESDIVIKKSLKTHIGHNLTWVILSKNRVVKERFAYSKIEKRELIVKPGVYRIYLKEQLDDGFLHKVSNEIVYEVSKDKKHVFCR